MPVIDDGYLVPDDEGVYFTYDEEQREKFAKKPRRYDNFAQFLEANRDTPEPGPSNKRAAAPEPGPSNKRAKPDPATAGKSLEVKCEPAQTRSSARKLRSGKAYAM